MVGSPPDLNRSRKNLRTEAEAVESRVRRIVADDGMITVCRDSRCLPDVLLPTKRIAALGFSVRSDAAIITDDINAIRGIGKDQSGQFTFHQPLDVLPLRRIPTKQAVLT